MLTVRSQLCRLAKVKWRNRSIQNCSWDFRYLDITFETTSLLLYHLCHSHTTIKTPWFYRHWIAPEMGSKYRNRPKEFATKPKGMSVTFTWCTNSLTFNNCTFCPRCIYVFCIYLRTNSDLRHLQHKLIGFYNRDEKCLLRDTNWVFNLLKPTGHMMHQQFNI